MNFASDNVYGVHPKIMDALATVNEGTAPSYSYDDGSQEAEAQLSRVFEKDVKAFLVTNGTAANGLALSAMVPPYGAIFAHAEAHIAIDECNSPEFLTGGAKIVGHHASNGKITPGLIEKTLKGFVRAEHDPKPSAISITNASELGTVYSPAEISAISGTVKSHGMKLHMDGARFANALVSVGCSPAELTWKAGVDVMSFGGTKNGCMFLEAVVFFDTAIANDFRYRRMRAGQLISKSRYLSAQMLAYLKDDLWLDTARRANKLARNLEAGLRSVPGVRITQAVQANEVFVEMPQTLCDRLHASGAKFYEWPTSDTAEGFVHVRFVLSFATPQADVTQFLEHAGKLS